MLKRKANVTKLSRTRKHQGKASYGDILIPTFNPDVKMGEKVTEKEGDSDAPSAMEEKILEQMNLRKDEEEINKLIASETAPETLENIKDAKYRELIHPETADPVQKARNETLANLGEGESIFAIHVMIFDKLGEIAVFLEREGKERNIPGGKIKAGETFEDGYKRELEEEMPKVSENWGSGAELIPKELDDERDIYLTVSRDSGFYCMTVIQEFPNLLEYGMSRQVFWKEGDAPWVRERFDLIKGGMFNKIKWKELKKLHSNMDMSTLSTFWEGWNKVKDVEGKDLDEQDVEVENKEETNPKKIGNKLLEVASGGDVSAPSTTETK